MRSLLLPLFLLLLFPLFAAADGPATGANCTLAWDAPVQGPTPEGYNLHYGNAPGVHPNQADMGNVLTTRCATIGINQAGQYHAVARSYSPFGVESVDSNQVSWVMSIPSAAQNFNVVVNAAGADCTMSWDAPPAAPVPEGYNLHYGSSPGSYPNIVNLGNVLSTTCAEHGITQVGQYHAVVFAYNGLGEAGVSSNESPFFLGLGAPSSLIVGP